MIVSVTNLKGGVGKSTISRNLAVYFAMMGEKVCIVDTDIEQRTACDWNERRSDAEHRVDVFPMSTVESLAKDVKTHQDNGYTVIIIDGVPQLEVVTTKMILLSDVVLIPITPSIDDIKSFERFLTRLQDAKAILQGVRQVHALVILNKYSGRNNEDLEMREALQHFETYGVRTLRAALEDRVAHKRSSKFGLTALEWDDDLKAKLEVVALFSELEKTVLTLTSNEV